MNWELSAAPYLPIHRRRLWRRRIVIALALVAIAVPGYLAYHRVSSEPVAARVFDDVAASVADAYYDPSFHGRSWDAVVARYRPLVDDAADPGARYLLLRQMLATLGDSHTMAFSPMEVGSFERRPDAGVSGASVEAVEDATVVMAVAPDSPAARAGIRKGDVVIGGTLGPGKPGELRRVRVSDPSGASIETRTLRLAPAVAVADDRPPEVDWNVVAPRVGYLRITAFPEAIDDVLGWAMTEIGSQPAIVLDLRSNPGGMLDAVDATAGLFLPRGALVVEGWRRNHWFGPQRFLADDSAGVHYRGRLVVIVDRSSQSGAETLAAALQSYHRAIVVGERSAGKVMGVDLQEPLPDGGLLRVATLDMTAPDGVRLEGRGIVPDVRVRRTPADIARGADPQLRAAIRLAQTRQRM